MPGNIFKGNQLEILEQQLRDYEYLINRKKDVEKRISDFKISNPDGAKYTLEQKDALLNLEMELQSYDDTLSNLSNSLYEIIPNLTTYKNVLDPKYDQPQIDYINNLTDLYDNLFGIDSDNVTKIFDDIWNSQEFSKCKTELETLSKAGKLDATVLESNEEYQTLLDATGKTAEETAKHINALVADISSDTPGFEDSSWDYTTTLQNLDKVKEKLEVLGQSYTKLFDANNSISFEDLSSISEAFSDVDGIEDYKIYRRH